MDFLINKIEFTIPQIKWLMYQLISGVEYLHSEGVMHRDIKGANLLLNNKGELKLTDFGLARKMSATKKNYTNRVVTLWYRAPELLLGSDQYGPAIDIWSVGCFFAELLTNVPLFPGDVESRQLDLIFQKWGFPNETIWPGVTSLKLFPKLDTKHYKYCLPEYFANCTKK